MTELQDSQEITVILSNLQHQWGGEFLRKDSLTPGKGDK